MKEQLRARLLKVFEAEHVEHLTVIRQVLETAAAGALTPEAINEAFRRAHSLKGAARAVDLSQVEQLAHHLESLFQRVVQASLTLGPAEIAVLHQALDLSEDLVGAELGQGAQPKAMTGLFAIEKLLGIEAPPDSEPARQPASLPAIVDLPAAPVAMPATQAAASSAESHPHLTAKPAAEAEEAPVDVPVDLPVFSPEGDQLRISASRLSTLLETADRLQSEGQRQRQAEELCRDLLDNLTELENFWEQSARGLDDPELELGMRSRLQALNRLGRATRALQRQSTWKLGQEVTLLQQDIREVRMLPARELFQGMPKLIRELAHEQGKLVQVRFIGWEIEADRAVLQAIKDPVMHSLRNAVAHGIESPEERMALGKDPTGQIVCSFKARGHQLCITIKDDGRGLDEARIRKQIGSGDEDWQQHIFSEGFSTARRVDRLSGRGMGLSVVSETVRRLQGELSVDSKPAHGFTLTLELPLHIATTHLLLAEARSQRFALPSASIGALLRIRPDEIKLLEGQAVIYFQERAVSFANLSELLWNQAVSYKGPQAVVLLRSNEHQLALAVDALLAERESVLKPLSGPAAELSLYLGAIQSPDGEPIPVLDPHQLFALAANTPVMAAPEADVEPPLILVVDDSITTRTLEQTILETQGYRVEVAVNGREALELAQRYRFDVIISDVQMPEMDGLELLATLKADPALAETPVILVTSLQADHDRRRGLELGAVAYLVKQKFEQQELLDVLRQFI